MPGDMYCMPVSYIPATTQQGECLETCTASLAPRSRPFKRGSWHKINGLPAHCEKPISITLPSHDMLYSDLYGYIGYRVRAGINTI